MAQGSTNAGGMGGGGILPAWWLEEKTVTAGERIEQYAPIEYRQAPGEYKLEGQVVSNVPTSTVAAASKGAEYIALLTSREPYLYLYRMQDDIFEQLPNPNDLPEDAFINVSITDDGRYLLLVSGTASPYLYLYERTENGLVRLQKPDIPLPAAPLNAVISPNGEYIAVMTSGENAGVLAYEIVDGVMTKRVMPSLVPATAKYNMAFSPDAEILIAAYKSGTGSSSTNIMRPFLRNDNGYALATGFINPVIAIGEEYEFSDTGQYLRVGTSSSDTRLYKKKEDGSGFEVVFGFASVMGSGAYGSVILPPGMDWVLFYRSNYFKMWREYDAGLYAEIPGTPNIAPSGTVTGKFFSKDGSRLYVFTNNTNNPVIMYATGIGERAMNMRDVEFCKHAAFYAEWYNGMGIALTSADKGEPLRIGLFGPINRAISGGNS